MNKLAFVKPAGPSWPLPLYDLALLTAADCAAHRSGVGLSLMTPKEEPLANLRQDCERRDPTAPGRILGDAAHEQLRHTRSLRVA